MTDQAPAIGAALRDVFPEVFHALCSWHIKQNAKKRLGSNATKMLFAEFKQLVKHVDNKEEFEYLGKHMLASCFLNRHTSEVAWLDFIYSSRRQWSSAWVKNSFTAGKTTTQLSEKCNAFARFYLELDHSITELFSRFQDLLDDLRHNELEADFNMHDQVVNNKNPKSTLMVHAASVFTPDVFKIIKNEYEQGKDYCNKAMPHMSRGSTQVVYVQRWDSQFQTNQTLVDEGIVEIDLDKCVVKCSCRFFENWWLRWCRDYKTSYPLDFQESARKNVFNYGERNQRLCGVMTGIGTRLCYNEYAYDWYMQKYLILFVRDFYIDDFDGVAAKFKKRCNPCKSKERLNVESKKRHFIWKQKRMQEMELLKNNRAPPNTEF